MFEDEYGAAIKPLPRIDLVLSDASLLLPPTGTPLTGIDFTKRLPCGEVERARKAIRTFFRLRQLSLDAQAREETQLPLSSPDSCVQVQDVLDLSKIYATSIHIVCEEPWQFWKKILPLSHIFGHALRLPSPHQDD